MTVHRFHDPNCVCDYCESNRENREWQILIKGKSVEEVSILENELFLKKRRNENRIENNLNDKLTKESGIKETFWN